MVVECDSMPYSLTGESTITVSAGGELSLRDHSPIGRFDETGTRIVQALSDNSTIQLQVNLSLRTSKPEIARNPKSRSGLCVFPASMIVYGPMNALESVGTFFQECELYLQDPIGCDRNVFYRNPHRFDCASNHSRMTFDLCPTRYVISGTQCVALVTYGWILSMLSALRHL
jgi:hypothetical protein